MSAPRPGAPRTRIWHPEDLLEIHPHDAENRGVDGDWCASPRARGRRRCGRWSRNGWRRVWSIRPSIIRRLQANVVTTDNSDWATNCPEYKVTAGAGQRLERPIGMAERVSPSFRDRPPHPAPGRRVTSGMKDQPGSCAGMDGGAGIRPPPPAAGMPGGHRHRRHVAGRADGDAP